MLNINILCVGKIKENYLRDSITEYSKRLSKYCKLEITELPDERIPEKLNDKIANIIKEKESDNIINHLKKDSYIVCLDLNGKELSSEEFSKHIDNISLNKSHITFIIGGSLGLSNKLLSICDYKICFSKMTFPHQLIRLFLLEQIYRGFKIINNETYHK